MNIKMRNKKSLVLLACLYLGASSAFALDPSTDFMQNGSTGTSPVKSGNTTTFNQDRNIDTYRWNKFNLAQDEVARFNFTNANSTAINYLTPGADPSTIMGRIEGTKNGNVFLFNPNGITFGAGASVNNVNTFMTSTNVFKEVDGTGNITFSEPLNKTKLTVDELTVNNATNVHFVAPSVAITSLKYGTQKPVSMSVRAIGCGNYSTTNNLFSNTLASSGTLPNGAIIDLGANLDAHNINVEAKVKSSKAESVSLRGNINSYKIDGTTGEIYILASNENADTNAAVNVVQSGIISGEEYNFKISGSNYKYTQNGNIDLTKNGETSTSKNINILNFNSYLQSKDITLKGPNELIIRSSNGSYNQTGIIKELETSFPGSNFSIDVSSLTINGEISIKNGPLMLSGSSNLTIAQTANIAAKGRLSLFSKNISIGAGDAGDTFQISASKLIEIMGTNYNKISLYAYNDLKINEETGKDIAGNFELNACRNIIVNKNINSKYSTVILSANYDLFNMQDFVKHDLRDDGKGTIIFDPSTIINADDLTLKIGEELDYNASAHHNSKALGGDIALNNTINASRLLILMANRGPCSVTQTGNLTLQSLIVGSENGKLNLASGNLSVTSLLLNAANLKIGNGLVLTTPIESVTYQQKASIDSFLVSEIINKLQPTLGLNLKSKNDINIYGIAVNRDLRLNLTADNNISMTNTTGELFLDTITAKEAIINHSDKIQICNSNIQDKLSITAKEIKFLSDYSGATCELMLDSGTGDIFLPSNITAKNMSITANKIFSTNPSFLTISDTLKIKVNGERGELYNENGTQQTQLILGVNPDTVVIELKNTPKTLDLDFAQNNAIISSYKGSNDLLKISASNIFFSNNFTTTGSLEAKAENTIETYGSIEADKNLSLIARQLLNRATNPNNVFLRGSENLSLGANNQYIYFYTSSINFNQSNTEGENGSTFFIKPCKTLSLSTWQTLTTRYSAVSYTDIQNLSLNANTINLRNNITMPNGNLTINAARDLIFSADCTSLAAKNDLILSGQKINLSANCNLTAANLVGVTITDGDDIRISEETANKKITIGSSSGFFNVNKNVKNISLKLGTFQKTISIDSLSNLDSLFVSACVVNFWNINNIEKMTLQTNTLGYYGSNKSNINSVVADVWSSSQKIKAFYISNIITNFNPTTLTLGNYSNRGCFSELEVEGIDFSNILLNLDTYFGGSLKSTGGLKLGSIKAGYGNYELQAQGDIALSGEISNRSVRLTSVFGDIKTISGQQIKTNASVELYLFAKDIDISAQGVLYVNDISASNNVTLKADSIAKYGYCTANTLNLTANDIYLEVPDINISNLSLTADKLTIIKPDTKVAINSLNFSRKTNPEQDINESILTPLFDAFTAVNTTIGSTESTGDITTNSYFDFGNTKLTVNTGGKWDIKSLNSLSIKGRGNTGNVTALNGEIVIDGPLEIRDYLLLTTLDATSGIRTNGAVDLTDSILGFVTNGDLNLNVSSSFGIDSIKCKNADISATNDISIVSILGNNINVTANSGAITLGQFSCINLTANAQNSSMRFMKEETSNEADTVVVKAKNHVYAQTILDFGKIKNLSIDAQTVNLNSTNDLNISSITGCDDATLIASRDINILGQIDTSKSLTIDSNKLTSANKNLSGADYSINSPLITINANILALNNEKGQTISTLKYLPQSQESNISSQSLGQLLTSFNLSSLTLGSDNFSGKIGDATNTIDFGITALTLKSTGDVVLNALSNIDISLLESANTTLTANNGAIKIKGALKATDSLNLTAETISSDSASYAITGKTIALKANTLDFKNTLKSTPDTLSFVTKTANSNISSATIDSLFKAFTPKALTLGSDNFSGKIGDATNTIDFGSTALTLKSTGDVVLNALSNIDISLLESANTTLTANNGAINIKGALKATDSLNLTAETISSDSASYAITGKTISLTANTLDFKNTLKSTPDTLSFVTKTANSNISSATIDSLFKAFTPKALTLGSDNFSGKIGDATNTIDFGTTALTLKSTGDVVLNALSNIDISLLESANTTLTANNGAINIKGALKATDSLNLTAETISSDSASYAITGKTIALTANTLDFKNTLKSTPDTLSFVTKTANSNISSATIDSLFKAFTPKALTLGSDNFSGKIGDATNTIDFGTTALTLKSTGDVVLNALSNIDISLLESANTTLTANNGAINIKGALKATDSLNLTAETISSDSASYAITGKTIALTANTLDFKNTLKSTPNSFTFAKKSFLTDISSATIGSIFRAFTPKTLTLGSDAYNNKIGDGTELIDFGSTNLTLNTKDAINLNALNDINLSGVKAKRATLTANNGAINIKGVMNATIGLQLTAVSISSTAKDTEGKDYGITSERIMFTADTLSLKNSTKSTINQLTFESKTASNVISSAEIINLFSVFTPTSLGLGLGSENTKVGDNANVIDFGTTLLSINTLGDAELIASSDINIAALYSKNATLTANNGAINIKGGFTIDDLRLTANSITSDAKDPYGRAYFLGGKTIALTANTLDFKNTLKSTPDTLSFVTKTANSNISSATIDSLFKAFTPKALTLGSDNFSGKIGDATNTIDFGITALTLKSTGDVVLNALSNIDISLLESANTTLTANNGAINIKGALKATDSLNLTAETISSDSASYAITGKTIALTANTLDFKNTLKSTPDTLSFVTKTANSNISSATIDSLFKAFTPKALTLGSDNFSGKIGDATNTIDFGITALTLKSTGDVVLNALSNIDISLLESANTTLTANNGAINIKGALKATDSLNLTAETISSDSASYAITGKTIALTANTLDFKNTLKSTPDTLSFVTKTANSNISSATIDSLFKAFTPKALTLGSDNFSGKIGDATNTIDFGTTALTLKSTGDVVLNALSNIDISLLESANTTLTANNGAINIKGALKATDSLNLTAETISSDSASYAITGKTIALTANTLDFKNTLKSTPDTLSFVTKTANSNISSATIDSLFKAFTPKALTLGSDNFSGKIGDATNTIDFGTTALTLKSTGDVVLNALSNIDISLLESANTTLTANNGAIKIKGALKATDSLNLTAETISSDSASYAITGKTIALTANTLDFKNTLKSTPDTLSFVTKTANSNISSATIDSLFKAFTPKALTLGSDNFSGKIGDATNTIDFGITALTLKSTGDVVLNALSNIDISLLESANTTLTANNGAINIKGALKATDSLNLTAETISSDSASYAITGKTIALTANTLDFKNTLKSTPDTLSFVTKTANSNISSATIDSLFKAFTPKALTLGSDNFSGKIGDATNTIDFGITALTLKSTGDVVLNALSNIDISLLESANTTLTANNGAINIKGALKATDSLNLTAETISSDSASYAITGKTIALTANTLDFKNTLKSTPDTLSFVTKTANSNISSATIDSLFKAFTPKALTLGSDNFSGKIGDATNTIDFGTTALTLKSTGDVVLNALSNIDISLLESANTTLTANNGAINIKGALKATDSLNLTAETISSDSASYAITGKTIALTANTLDFKNTLKSTPDTLSFVTKTANSNISSATIDSLFKAFTPKALTLGSDNFSGKIGDATNTIDFGTTALTLKSTGDVVLNALSNIDISLLESANTTLTANNGAINIKGALKATDSLNLTAETISSDSASYAITGKTIALTANTLDFKNTLKSTPDTLSFVTKTANSNISSATIDSLFKAFTPKALTLGSDNFSGKIGDATNTIDFGTTALTLKSTGDIELKASSDINIAALNSKNTTLTADKNITLATLKAIFDGEFNIESKETLTVGSNIVANKVQIKANKFISSSNSPIEITGKDSTAIALKSQDFKISKNGKNTQINLSNVPTKETKTIQTLSNEDQQIVVGDTQYLSLDAGDNNDITINGDYDNKMLKELSLAGKNIKTSTAETKTNIWEGIEAKISLLWRGKNSPHVTNDKSRWSPDREKESVLISDNFGNKTTKLDISTTNADLWYSKDINYEGPTPGQRISLSAKEPYQVKLESTPTPTPPPTPATGGGSNSAGAIVGGTVGGAAAAGSAGMLSPLFLPGLLIGASASMDAPLLPVSLYDGKIIDELQSRYEKFSYILKAIEENSLNNSCNSKYILITDINIAPGSYNVATFKIPKELACKQIINVKMTQISNPIKTLEDRPELNSRLYMNKSMKDITKLYSRQSYWKIKKRNGEIIFNTITSKCNAGVIKKTGKIDLSKSINDVGILVTSFNLNGRKSHLPKGVSASSQRYAVLLEFSNLDAKN